MHGVWIFGVGVALGSLLITLPLQAESSQKQREKGSEAAQADAASPDDDSSDGDSASGEGAKPGAAEPSGSQGASAALSDKPSRPHAITFGVDAYWDSGTSKRRSVFAGPGDLSESENDFSSDGLLALSLGYLTHLSERVRFGGTLRYFGNYTYSHDENPDQTVTLGRLVELAIQAEFVVPIIEPLDVLLGGQLGMAVLFPGGELSGEIDSLGAQGYNTWSAPRLGYVMGPQVGGRYKYNEWLAFRADLAVLWQQLFLLDASAEAAGLTSEQTWRASLTRMRVGLAGELLF